MARRRDPQSRRHRPAVPRRQARSAAGQTTGHPRATGKSGQASDPPAAPARRRASAEAVRLGSALAAEIDVTRGLERLLSAARRLTRAEAGTVYLRRGEALEFAAVQNDVLARQIGEAEVRRRVGARPLPLGENSIASYVLLTRSTVNLRDAYEIPIDRPYTLFREVDRSTDYQTCSMLALPLRDGRGRVFGVLQLINALDRRGAVRAFSRVDQQRVHELAAQTVRLPGATAS